MTHDESATWLYAQQWDIITTLWNSEAWGTANNHYLNSLLLKFNNNLFGVGDFQSRLHSVIAFLLMGYWGIKLISKLYLTDVSRSLAFVFLFFNVYLFDFFSLARGYAGAIAFLIGAILFLYKYFEQYDTKDLFITYIFLTISSLFLFTHLIFIPVFTLVLWVQVFTKTENRTFKYREILIPIIFGLLVLWLIWVPIIALNNNTEFSWGTGSFYNSIVEIIKDSFYDRKFLGKYTYQIIGLSTIFICITVAINVLIRLKSSRLKLLISLFVVFILFLFIANALAGIQFPVNRKGLIYLPFLCLIIPGIFEGKKLLALKNYLAIVLTIFTVSIFFYNLNLRKVHEWYYDYSTKEFIQAVISDAGSAPATLATHWGFHWTAKYYLQTSKKKHQISQKPYSKELDTLNLYDYYMVEEKHLKSMAPAYRPFTNYDVYKNVVLTTK